ncbi:MAG: DUF3971 domain-containing protein, partial [Halioglobus sp.]
MENAFFHRLSNILWGVMVILIVLLAIYVSLGRMLTANLGAYQGPILQVLNSRVPFTIGAQRVSGEWQSFTPVIVLSGLQLSAPGSAESPLELAEGRIAVDVLNSLRTRSLQMTRVALDGLRLRGELGAQGKFRLSGLDGGGGQITQWLEEFLLNVELVALHNNVLKLAMPNGEQRELDLELLLSRDGSYRHVEAQLISTAGTDITILAEGVGNPFAPELFNGDLYLDIQSSDLGALKHMLGSGLPPVWADGSLQLELWLAWSKGKPALEARLEAHDLVIGAQDEAWQVPLDRVGLEARLVQRRNHWTVFASGLEVEQDDVLLQLPRLQFDVWGDALRVRLPDVSLAPINAIASNLDAMPEALADVLHTLQPRGQLSALQLSIGDLNDLAGDWEVEANFEALAVESWKGAPGVSSASGYAQVTSRGGFVVLDSQNLTMDFPMIYRQVLHYDDFYGTININWDEQAVNLSSGLITTQGDEGTVHALFGLDIPLVPNDIGIEMDLLVGFADAHPLHRVKYVPYLLDESLIDWLTTSIQEGRIDQGAFLWRGSVKRNSAPLHTIQLAFNVTDTALEFHPQWPPVTVHDGVIIIDDADVSVWANQASLLGSSVNHLSVETWLNNSNEIMLSVDGSLQGPAADGLSVLNDSPLTTIVGTAFAGWNLSGDLSTDLQLQMNLTNKLLAPTVEVATHWRDVDLDIVPGNLSVGRLNGVFNYSTEQGFSSQDLTGAIWGGPLKIALVQQHLASGDGYEAGSSVVDVVVGTQVNMDDVRQWLNLPSLAFVQGKTTADIKIRIAPGEAPVLKVDSALLGVSLDLPEPWDKSSETETAMHLEMPLVGNGNLLSITLGEHLNMRLNVVDGVLRSGALSVDQEPAALDDGVLRINGHAPLVQADEWIRFVSNYFVADPTVQNVDISATRETGEPLAIIIDQVQADSLVLWGQEFSDVLFSLAIEPDLWRLAFDTSWLQGTMLLAQDDGVSQLDIARLDLSGLEQLNLALGDSQQVLELPDIDVT